MPITPSTGWPVACWYICAIARPDHAKSAVALTDCHRLVGRMGPNTWALPGDSATSTGRSTIRSVIWPRCSNVSSPG